MEKLSLLTATGRQARSAEQIASEVASGKSSAVAVLDEHLARIEQVNPAVNAVVTPLFGRAAAQAEAVDRRLRAGERQLPLAGVPFTVKDIISVAGSRCTAGSLVLADYVAERTAPAVERLEAAGALLVGKSNCSEFALEMHATNRVFGDTWNPWDLKLTPGGSSGGDSAAVSSGSVAFGVGTDYSGSIRWPAHCTGLASLRPTPGVIPSAGQLPFSISRLKPGPEGANWLQPPNSVSLQTHLQLVCPIARYVDDLWLLLRVMSGIDAHDERSVPAKLGSPDDVIAKELKVAWCDGDGTIPVSRDLVAVVRDAAGTLRAAGLDVVEQRLPAQEHVLPTFVEMRLADGLSDHRQLVGDRLDMLTPSMRERLESDRPATVEDYRHYAAERDALRTAALEFMEHRPILLLPIASVQAFEPDPPSFTVEGRAVPRQRIVGSSAIGSFLGLPCLAVPFGRSATGHPAGVQLVGRPFHDHELIALGRLLEDAALTRWAER